jgi:hypothetical protein
MAAVRAARRTDLSPQLAAAIAETLDTGYGDPIGNLPSAFSHRPSDLADELREAGAADSTHLLAMATRP